MSARERLLRYLAFVALALLTRGVLLGAVPVGDESAHLVGSWELMRGHVLYLHFADNKPPLLYVYYALGQLLFGHGMDGVRVLTILAALPLTAWAASAFFGHGRAGLAAGVLYLLGSAAFTGDEMLSVSTESLLLLPASWALVLVRDAERAGRPVRAFGAGVLLGLAALFKPTALLWLAAPPLALLAVSRPGAGLRAGLALGAGAALPLALTFVAFEAAGYADALVYWTITHNRIYAVSPARSARVAERFATRVVPWMVATLPLWWAAFRALGRRPPYERALLASAVALALPAAVVGLRFFPHYFVQLYLPLSLAAACAFEAPWREWPRGLRAAAVSLVVLVVGFTGANLVLFRLRTDVYEETRPLFAEVARRLDRDPCRKGATLFVWGYAPMFYTATGIPPASRFVVPTPGLTGFVPGRAPGDPVEAGRNIRSKHRRWLLEDLQSRGATYVLDTAPSGFHRWNRFPMSGFPELATYVRENYEELDGVGGVAIHRRRGCTSPPR